MRLSHSIKIRAVKSFHATCPFQRLGFAMRKSDIIGQIKTRNIRCSASQAGSAVASFEKVDFMKLQNGSDIRGVAVEGVEGESVNLTEPVTEAIASAFAGWLLNKKKIEGPKRLRVSVGHDSRISAQRLQDAISHGLVSAGFEVVQFGLASTPAMFNSTLTQDESNLCPAHGSIMITGFY